MDQMAERYLDICTTDDIPPGRSMPFMIEDEAVLICHAEGALHAVRNLCTHADARLDYGKLIGGSIVCPMHNARYDLRTGQASHGFLKPLRVYKLRIEGKRVLISLD